MPELPEVETFRKYFEATSLRQKITDIEVESPALVKPSMDLFADTLMGQEFVNTHRIGKYLFVRNSSPRILIFHFGMTGWLSYFKDIQEQPDYTRVLFRFDSGFNLAFVCKRKLGWINLTEDISGYQKETRLGPDALDISLEEFKKRLGGRKSPIKPRLLDQKILAGVGNWIADEMLYQSGIHPETSIHRLTGSDLTNLYESMVKVLRVAVEKEAVWQDFPEYFLTHQRNKHDPTCYYTGRPLVKYMVGGRPTYISIDRQKKK